MYLFTYINIHINIYLYIYLCTLHFAVDAVTVVALLLPATAVRKLQPSVVAVPPDADDCPQKQNTFILETGTKGKEPPMVEKVKRGLTLLTSSSRSSQRADAPVAVDLVHARGSVGAG